jgi:DNA (cytosine-5)-methyltransferase 1
LKILEHLDLFSGIGGFALAARWMNWTTVQFVEIDSFCQKVLTKNFPNIPIHGDIKTFNGTKYRGAIDILTGGFPCQTFSLAGLGAMDLTLWKEMFRVIKQSGPWCVVVENVYGILARKGGMALEIVCADLESEGYEVQPFIIPACSKGAPHRRERVWIIAYSHAHDARRCGHGKTRPKKEESKSEQKERKRIRPLIERVGYERTSTHPNGIRLRKKGDWERESRFFNETSAVDDWANFPTQSPVRIRNDGIPTRLVRSAISGGGNAVVPQLVFEIFKAIESLKREG